MKRFLLALISFYQRTLSPDHGMFVYRFPHGYCRYHPSCSEYAKQSIQKYGVFTGTARSVARVFGCNPFSRGGTDLA